MAATGIEGEGPPNLNLTADIPSATETNAPTAQEQEERPGTLPPVENKGVEHVGENAEKDQTHRDSVRQEDSATPAHNHNGLPHTFEVNNSAQQTGEKNLQQEPIHEDQIHPGDAAIPQLNHDALQAGYEFPDQAGLEALMAMQQLGQLGQLGYNPGLTLVQAAALDVPMIPVPNHDGVWMNPEDYIPDANRPEDRLVGYAKLVFEDGEFYMNTHSVILGRDPAAHRAAQRREKEEAKRKIEAETPGPRTPVQIKRDHISYSKSVFSEKSGILREGSDSDPEARERRRQRRKASKKSKSTGSSHELSRRNSLAQLPSKTHVYEAQYPGRTKEENAVPVDPASLRPDPNECPLIPLHPAGTASASDYKSISREHVKIAYNFNKAIFEMHIYGRNGAFVDEVYHPMNSVVELRSGNVLQIGKVPLQFILPDGIIGDGQLQYDDEVTDSRSRGGKEMSFDFEEDKRNGVPEDTSPELVSNDGDEDEDEDEEGEGPMNEKDEELEAGGDEDEEEELENSDQEQDHSGVLEGEAEEDGGEQENQTATVAPSSKKRGPGRPPKNGIMSAREEREQKAALKAAAALGNQKSQKGQKSVPQSTSALPPEKKKVGRPRKHEKPDPTEPEKPKRKYTKRKPKEPKEGDARQEGSDAEDQAAKEKKEKKLKPPRSPSPQFDEATLTPDQLAKPQANYVTLIYEALSNSKEGKLGLPQIYRAIQRKYPYFVLKVGTLGWQSSVRHNLSQHHAFQKVERDGKGWMWGIVDGVSIEKEKKRRTPPPPQLGGPMHHQPIYQAGQPPYIHGQYPYHHQPMMGHPGYMHSPPHPGQPPQFIGPPQHMNGHPHPLNPQLPTNPINPGLAAAIIPQMAGKRAYSSPYAASTVPPTAPQPSEQGPSNEEQPSTQDPPPQAPSQDPPQKQATQMQSPPAQQPQNQPTQSQPPQSQTLQGQQPQSQPYQGLTPPAASQQPPLQPTKSAPELPQHNQQVIAATERFKKNMLEKMRAYPEIEEILNSAVNQVLGYTQQSSVPGNTHEEIIMRSLRGMLEKIPGSNITPATPNITPVSQTNGQQPQSSQANQNETHDRHATPQPSKTSGAEKPTPTVMRPTFTGQGQSRPNVPRPPMGTPSMKRTNSGSPAQQPEGQLAGQKRALEDAEEYKDVKRLNGSGMSPLKT
jgi:hypothetical protein